MKKTLLFLILIFPLLLTSLACQALNQAGETYRQSREAVEAVSTLAEGLGTQNPGLLETAGAFVAGEGQTLAGTAAAFATQNPGLLETAGAFVAGEGQTLAGTAEAFATQNPGLLETAQALAERRGPAIVSTAQALATQQHKLVETAKAVLPDGAGATSPLPDIPLPASLEIEIHFSGAQALSFSTQGAYQELLDFYKLEMPAQGWELDSAGSMEASNTASLVYTRPGRSATIAIDFSDATGRTLVMIFTEDR